jgi:hypothetical protein
MDRAISEPTGVRFVLARSTDTTREREFNAWYDGYVAETLGPGFLINGGRYEDVARDGTGERPPYAAIYDIAMDDPGRAWPLTAEHFGASAAHMLSPLLEVPLRATYATLGVAATPARLIPPAAVAITLSDVAEGATAAEGARWIEETLEDRRAAGGFQALAAFTIVDGAPDPPRFLELGELAGGAPPRDAAPGGPLRVRLSGTYRLISWTALSTARSVDDRVGSK